MIPIPFIRRLLPWRSGRSVRIICRENEVLRGENEAFRAAREVSEGLQTLLLRRVAFLEGASHTATRLIREAQSETERTHAQVQELEARLSLAVSDRLLATRMNEELLREIQRLSGVSSGAGPNAVRSDHDGREAIHA